MRLGQSARACRDILGSRGRARVLLVHPRQKARPAFLVVTGLSTTDPSPPPLLRHDARNKNGHSRGRCGILLRVGFRRCPRCRRIQKGIAARFIIRSSKVPRLPGVAGGVSPCHRPSRNLRACVGTGRSERVVVSSSSAYSLPKYGTSGVTKKKYGTTGLLHY